MTSFETPPTSFGEPQAQPKGWFGRNWVWFVPTIILVPLLCCCGGGGLLTWYGMNQVLNLPVYKDSVALAQQDEDVQDALGTPITAPTGFMEFVEMMQSGGQFEMNNYGSIVEFDAAIPLTGPNDTGTLTIDADSTDGGITWTYNQLDVTIDSTGEAIDLLESSLLDDATDAAKDALQAIEDAFNGGSSESADPQ